MISLNLVRWLLGWVAFRISPRQKGGGERFLNLTARLGISLWRIRRSGDCLYATVAVGQYRDLCAPARKAGVRLRAGKRRGLPFLVKKLGRRKGLLVGAAAFVCILWALSLYVWSVEIKGNTTIPTERISAAAAELGLEPGVLKDRVDALSLQRQLMLKFPDVAWLSVNTHGCGVTVELAEKIKLPEITDAEKICNIKASASGQILRMEVYRGQAQVKVGDAVIKDQLLISGVTENKLGGTQLEHAAGRVVAATTQSLTAEVPLKETVSVPTGRQVVRRSVKIFGVQLPLSFVGAPEGNFRRDFERTPVRGMTGVLPVSIFTETWTEETEREVTLTAREAKERAEKELLEQQKEKWKDLKIISGEKTEKTENGVYRLTLTCQCEENIAVESEILFK